MAKPFDMGYSESTYIAGISFMERDSPWESGCRRRCGSRDRCGLVAILLHGFHDVVPGKIVGREVGQQNRALSPASSSCIDGQFLVAVGKGNFLRAMGVVGIPVVAEPRRFKHGHHPHPIRRRSRCSVKLRFRPAGGFLCLAAFLHHRGKDFDDAGISGLGVRGTRSGEDRAPCRTRESLAASRALPRSFHADRSNFSFSVATRFSFFFGRVVARRTARVPCRATRNFEQRSVHEGDFEARPSSERGRARFFDSARRARPTSLLLSLESRGLRTHLRP